MTTTCANLGNRIVSVFFTDENFKIYRKAVMRPDGHLYSLEDSVRLRDKSGKVASEAKETPDGRYFLSPVKELPDLRILSDFPLLESAMGNLMYRSGSCVWIKRLMEHSNCFETLPESEYKRADYLMVKNRWICKENYEKVKAYVKSLEPELFVEQISHTGNSGYFWFLIPSRKVFMDWVF